MNPGWPRPEFREICFEIWAKVDFEENFAKFGPDLEFRKRNEISPNISISLLHPSLLHTVSRRVVTQ